MERSRKKIERDTPVIYKGKEYMTGGCWCGLVELYKNKTFITIVSISEVKIKSIPHYQISACSNILFGEDGDVWFM